MGAKQDRTYARTAQDLERKWKFGKSFAELIGLINDNRDKVDSVESTLRDEILEQSTTLKRDTEQIVMQATETIRTEVSEEFEGVNEIITGAYEGIAGVSDDVAGVKESISDVNDNIVELSSKVEMKLTADEVSIIVDKEIANGVDRVETKTGYVFDENGLNISKTGSEIANTIDNTGMYVKKSGTEVLTANANGVKATDLHANTYLIIGKGNGRSRFEDYEINRTACFWIGG